jgi:hypothetical protein
MLQDVSEQTLTDIDRVLQYLDNEPVAKVAAFISPIINKDPAERAIIFAALAESKENTLGAYHAN